MTTQTAATVPTVPAAATPRPHRGSAVHRDSVWRLPTTVCRITDLLGKEASDGLLNRAIGTATGTMKASTIRDGEVVPGYRRSRSDGTFTAPELIDAIMEILPSVEKALGVSCPDSEVSYGLNVHNDGDYYRAHQDVGTQGFAAKRLLTFVYYLHRTPRPFEGGALRVYDGATSMHDGGRPLTWEDRAWQDWGPDHDSIVFFLPDKWHEVRTVTCPGKDPANSRFAVNGWLCTPAG